MNTGISKSRLDAYKPVSRIGFLKQRECDAFEAGMLWGRAHWKANHDNIVKRLRVFTNRPDLPVDRTQAYKEICQLQTQVQRLTESLRIMEEALIRQNRRGHA